MENLSSVQTTKCSLCRKPVPVSQIFCSNCGYPQHGTVEQKEKYKKERAQKRHVLEASRNRIYRVTGILGFVGVVAGIIFILGIFLNPLPIILVISGLGVVLYGGLAYWSLQKPFPAILIGLILFATFFITDIVVSIVKGIDIGIVSLIFRLLILYFFIRGVIAAKKLSQLEKELEK